MTNRQEETELETAATSETNAIAELAVAAAGALNVLIADHGIVVHPKGMELVDLEPFQDVRRRPRGTFKTTVAESYLRIVNESPTALTYIDPDALTAVTIFNQIDAEGFPGHCDHRAVLTLRTTPEWEAVTSLQGCITSQADLVEWFEDWSSMVPSFADAQGQHISLAQALAAFRNITVIGKSLANHAEQEMGRDRTLLESIEVRDADQFPSRAIVTVQRALELPAINIHLRILPLAAKEGSPPRIRIRAVGWSQVIESTAQSFRALIEAGIKTPVAVGAFYPGD